MCQSVGHDGLRFIAADIWQKIHQQKWIEAIQTDASVVLLLSSDGFRRKVSLCLVLVNTPYCTTADICAIPFSSLPCVNCFFIFHFVLPLTLRRKQWVRFNVSLLRLWTLERSCWIIVLFSILYAASRSSVWYFVLLNLRHTFRGVIYRRVFVVSSRIFTPRRYFEPFCSTVCIRVILTGKDFEQIRGFIVLVNHYLRQTQETYNKTNVSFDCLEATQTII